MPPVVHDSSSCVQLLHYLCFQVFQGILLACEDRFNGDESDDGLSATASVKYLVSLWAHECSRVFSDKMTSHDDKMWVESAIMKVAK